MAETKETNAEARAKLIAAAHEVVTAIAGSAADDIVLVPPRGVPKTSSGKVRRSSAKELYETGRTDVKQSGVWLQIARLALSSAGRIGDELHAPDRRHALCGLVVSRHGARARRGLSSPR